MMQTDSGPQRLMISFHMLTVHTAIGQVCVCACVCVHVRVRACVCFKPSIVRYTSGVLEHKWRASLIVR